MDERLLEMWLRMNADAVRGASDARRAVQTLSGSPLSADAVSSWMNLWLPSFSFPSGRTRPADDLRSLVEEWWSALGVVPRYQYTQLLKRYEEVKRQLEEAQETVRRLRELLREKGHEAEAAAVLDAWERVTRETLRLQEDWARVWGDALRPKE